MKPIRIVDDIYHAHIYIIPKADKDELIKFFYKKYGITYKYDVGCAGMHYRVSNEAQGVDDHYLIFNCFKNTPEGIGIFNHEISHLVFSVLSISGLKYCKQSEEAYTYFLSYLTEKILDKLV
jgi:hypothetical protein